MRYYSNMSVFCIHKTKLDIFVLMYKEHFLFFIQSLFFLIDISSTNIITCKVTIIWFNQKISALNLFFHNNDYLVISVIPSKAVSLGPYTQRPKFTPLLKYSVKCDAWDLSNCILWFCLNHCVIIKFLSL